MAKRLQTGVPYSVCRCVIMEGIVDITVRGYNEYNGYGLLCVKEPELVQVFT